MTNSTNNGRGFAALSEYERTDIARKGGKARTGKFGSAHGADPQKAGKKGNAAEPHEAKVRGGENSHRSDQDEVT